MPDPILHQDIVNFEDLIFNQASSRDTYYKSISDAILNINRGGKLIAAISSMVHYLKLVK